MTDIFLDERFIGNVENKEEFVTKLKKERLEKDFLRNINLYYDEEFDEMYLNSCKGRARRPILVVEEGKSKLTKTHIDKLQSEELSWENLVKEGVIEYLDAGEEE